jgi:hypothetical protein
VGTLTAANYTFTFAPGTLTLNSKTTPTVTTLPTASGITYGQTLSSSTLAGGLASVGGAFAWTTSTTVPAAGTPSESVTFTPTDTTDYNTVTVSVTVAVSKATLTVTANNLTLTAGSTIPTLTATITGFVNGDTIAAVTGTASCTTTATSASPAGTYPITCTVGTLTAANYTFTFAPGTLTVTQATQILTVTANNQTRSYGASNPTLTYTITGFVNGDTIAVVSGAAACTTTATAASPVSGSPYPITCTVGTLAAANYIFTFMPGTLAITQAGTTTSVTASSSSVTPGQNVMLTAQVDSATTGTPTGSVAFYDGTTLLGTAPITAGAAAISTTSLTAGSTNAISAVYSGDNNFTTSTGSISIGVAALDFSLVVSGADSATVNPGSPATYQVSVTPLYGNYPGPVSFTASGLPTGASITFSPSTIAANGGTQTVTLTVQTAATAMEVSPATARKLAPLTLAFLLIPLLGVRRMRRQGSRLSRLATLLLLLSCTLAGVMMTGCGGVFTQVERNYTIMITATSGNMQHTAPVTLKVE